MFVILLGVIAFLALGAATALGVLLVRLEGRLRAAEQVLESPTRAALPEAAPVRPLEGLRVALDIRQDHTHPVFANLLKEQLLAEDVTDLTTPDTADIVIEGNLVCNGYAEIYYEADFTCRTATEPICTLIEKPPHGDRPQNLAIELVARLKRELTKLESRNERRAAIRELRGNERG
jgi:hypothetical protein